MGSEAIYWREGDAGQLGSFKRRMERKEVAKETWRWRFLGCCSSIHSQHAGSRCFKNRASLTEWLSQHGSPLFLLPLALSSSSSSSQKAPNTRFRNLSRRAAGIIEVGVYKFA